VTDAPCQLYERGQAGPAGVGLLPGQEHPLVHRLESSDVAHISLRESFFQLRSSTFR
jgi:hypothetical protein